MPGAPKANAQSEINAGSSLFNATSLACVRALPFSALKIQGYREFFKWLLSMGPHEGLLKADASCEAMLTPRAKYPGPVNWAAFVVIGERDCRCTKKLRAGPCGRPRRSERGLTIPCSAQTTATTRPPRRKDQADCDCNQPADKLVRTHLIKPGLHETYSERKKSARAVAVRSIVCSQTIYHCTSCCTLEALQGSAPSAMHDL